MSIRSSVCPKSDCLALNCLNRWIETYTLLQMLFTIFLLLPKRVTKLSSFISFDSLLFLKYPFVVIEHMKRDCYRQYEWLNLNYLLIHQSYVMWQSLDWMYQVTFWLPPNKKKLNDFYHLQFFVQFCQHMYHVVTLLVLCTCAHVFAEYSFHVHRRSILSIWLRIQYPIPNL